MDTFYERVADLSHNKMECWVGRTCVCSNGDIGVDVDAVGVLRQSLKGGVVGGVRLCEEWLGMGSVRVGYYMKCKG
jgi:hypothetical protein